MGDRSSIALPEHNPAKPRRSHSSPFWRRSKIRRVYGATTKLLGLASVPPGVVTAIGPVVAPAGTVAVIFVDDLTTKVAMVPLKVTAVAPVKLLPLMVTDVPTGPLVGEMLLMIGAGVKVPALVTDPAGVVTLIVPVVLPAGTTAEI
jgi:hypothetical protein